MHLWCRFSDPFPLRDNNSVTFYLFKTLVWAGCWIVYFETLTQDLGSGWSDLEWQLNSSRRAVLRKDGRDGISKCISQNVFLKNVFLKMYFSKCDNWAAVEGQFSGRMVEMVSDGWIHCPRWLDGWLRMRDGWPKMVVTRLCPLMASMAINRLIGDQRRTDSNHCQSDVSPPQCTSSGPFLDAVKASSFCGSVS